MQRILAVAVLLAIVATGCRGRVEKPVAEEINVPEAPGISPVSGAVLPLSSVATPVSAVMVPESAEPVEKTDLAAPAALEQPTAKEIQQALKNAGLYHGEIDGVVGKMTKQAILEFQRENELKADGKVGPKTWAKLQPFLNEPPEVQEGTPAAAGTGR